MTRDERESEADGEDSDYKRSSDDGRVIDMAATETMTVRGE